MDSEPLLSAIAIYCYFVYPLILGRSFICIILFLFTLAIMLPGLGFRGNSGRLHGGIGAFFHRLNTRILFCTENVHLGSRSGAE